MDAKPQRLRVFQVGANDENVAPGLLQASHVLDKSNASRASTSMGNAGALKVAAKRTAFADVSNTSTTTQKAAHEGVKKSGALDFGTKDRVNGAQEAFLRPAQRLSRQSVASALAQQTHPKPVGGKKASFVYDDSHGNGDRVGNLEAFNSLVSQPTSTLAVQNRQVRQYKSQPQLKADNMPVLRRTQSKQFGTNSPEAVNGLFPLDNVTEALYEDALEHLPRTDAGYLALHPVSDMVDVGGEEKMATIMSEPDEYWEEEEEEIYDDGGYTTAHSFRSRLGDFTTGAITTVVHPKVTTKVLRELEAARVFVEATRPESDIEEDLWDVSMVAEYGEEIFEYMRVLEDRLLPNPHYMDNQTEIQWSMRSVLMDWLVQVHNRFNLLPETLFLAVNLIDRFLSNKVVSLGKLQLVGATAILVASKYEEINCPSLQEIVYMVDNGYTLEEVTKAERYMLTILNFELGWPGPMSFLRRISKADDYEVHTRTLAKYFLEVAMMDERFVGSPCSFLAAGAHCLSRFMLGKGDWTAGHVHYSGYTWSQLKPLLGLIVDCCQVPHQHHMAVFEKYNDKRFKFCSNFVHEEIKKGFAVPSHQPNILPMPASMSQRSGCAGDGLALLQHPRCQIAPEA